DGGLDVRVDLTGSSPLTQTGMIEFAPGQAVIVAAQHKCANCLVGVAWYLDDGTIIGDTLIVGEVLKVIMEDGDSFGFSGGDVYPCQAYDRILVTTEQLSELVTCYHID
ncbi:hypothetical protein Tco_1178422, partial [Tanacetum coccineum]